MKNEELFDRFMDRSRHHHGVCFAQAAADQAGACMRLLDFLESREIPKVVATSTPRKTAIARLEQCGILHRFATVSCGDEVLHGKPAPDLFLQSASTIRIEPKQCVVLEDSEAGVIGAHAAGMSVCMVPDMKRPSDEVRRLARGVYESLHQVRELLQQVM